MAILFKGSPLVKGKNFILENEKVTYIDKVYGDHYLFLNEGDGSEIVLDQVEVNALKPYKTENGKVVIEAQEDKDDLYQLLVHYTDKIIKVLGSEYSEDLNWGELRNILQECVNKFASLGYSFKQHYSKADDMTPEKLYETIKYYLEGLDKNISETSLPALTTMLNQFIYYITTLKKEVKDNGDME